MEKYTIKCSKWNRETVITAEPWFADELFDALCDYYGIDTDDIERGYIPGDTGDIFADAIGYESGSLKKLLTITKGA